ncbi:MAG: YqaJ viral recombinase family protein [Terriglobales bacterium]
MWELTQGTPEWLAVRSCYLTASDFATVLGFNPYKSLTEFVNTLTSSEPETCCDPSLSKPMNKRSKLAMQWGTDHEEDGVFEYFLMKYGFNESTWPITAPGLVIDYNKKLAVSPDRFVGDDGILEVIILVFFVLEILLPLYCMG